MRAGIQMIYKRRPIVTAKAAEALMVRTLDSGANVLVIICIMAILLQK